MSFNFKARQALSCKQLQNLVQIRGSTASHLKLFLVIIAYVITHVCDSVNRGVKLCASTDTTFGVRTLPPQGADTPSPGSMFPA